MPNQAAGGRSRRAIYVCNPAPGEMDPGATARRLFACVKHLVTDYSYPVPVDLDQTGGPTFL
jgi:hypothetical protein